jgi:ATPase subunit of ABC transporter with duplicated ATPase domains
MRAIEVRGLSFAQGVPLFSDVAFRLDEGWTGLVGANGSGKTTLVRLIARELAPSSGSIRVVPDEAEVVVCDQRVEDVPSDVQDLATGAGARRRWLGRLALDPAQLERWATLSPGERKRWQLGAALSREPDVLVVDEPTNHLDAGAREVLRAALAQHRGIGVLVSHDRALLDELTTRTLRIHGGAVRLYSGGYAHAREQWEAEARRTQEEREAASARHERARRALADARRQHDGAKAALSSKSRMKDRNDRDARGVGAKFRAEKAEAKVGRTVALARAATERAARALDEIRIEKGVGRDLFIGYEPCPKPRVLELAADEIVAGDRVLLRDVRLVLERDARVELRGPNGAGKTTLLRRMIERAGTCRDRLLVLPQELDVAESLALRRALDELSHVERGRVLSMAAALGLDADRLLASRAPSPGEARKLAIAFGLARHAWALVLDEPTNHLDLPSIERLEAALSEYPGAILLVCHDEQFAQRLTTRTWTIDVAARRVHA